MSTVIEKQMREDPHERVRGEFPDDDDRDVPGQH